MAVDKNGRQLPPGIRQRSNGKYEGRVKYSYKSYSIYGDTITEIKKKMNDLRYKLEHGEFVAESKITLDVWFNTWMEQYKVGRVKEGTAIAYQNYYNYYIKDRLGKSKMLDIRGDHIQKLYNELRGNLDISSIKIISAVLNGCFKQGVKNGIIERNPVVLATLPRSTVKRQHRVLTKEEQNLFMEYSKDSYLYNLFDLAIRTGLRSGEIRGLKLSDIDKNNQVIHVRRTLKYETGRGFFEDTPKTQTSWRDIPLTDEMVFIIEEQKKALPTSKIVMIDEYIFHTDEGRPISRERLQIEIDRTLKKIENDGEYVERFTPHCFRHTFATRAIENGMQPQTLKSILGHSTLSMTMDLYSHVLPTTKAEEMKKISKAF